MSISAAAVDGADSSRRRAQQRSGSVNRSCPSAQSSAGTGLTPAPTPAPGPPPTSPAPSLTGTCGAAGHDAGRALACISRAALQIISDRVESTGRDLWCSHQVRRSNGTGSLKISRDRRPQPANRVQLDDGGGIVDPSRGGPGQHQGLGRRALSPRPTSRVFVQTPSSRSLGMVTVYQFFNRMFRGTHFSSAHRHLLACRWRHQWACSA